MGKPFTTAPRNIKDIVLGMEFKLPFDATPQKIIRADGTETGLTLSTDGLFFGGVKLATVSETGGDAPLVLSTPPVNYYSGVDLSGSVVLSGNAIELALGLDTDGTLNSRPKYTGTDGVYGYILSYSGTRWDLAINEIGFWTGGTHNWTCHAVNGTEATPDEADWADGSSSAETSGYPVTDLGSGGTAGEVGQLAIVAEAYTYVCLRSSPAKWQGPLQIIS